MPGAAIVADDGALGRIFHLAGPGGGSIERNLGIVGRNGCSAADQAAHLGALRTNALQGSQAEESERQQGNERAGHPQSRLHRLPPNLTSLPATTPEATVMVAPGTAGNSAWATPRLTRASTVERVWPSLSTNVTMVPSGTGFPLQSRTGSVSTSTPFFAGAAWKRRSQGSEATCCTTRRTCVSPTDATNCAAPAFRAESSRVQAMPSCDCTLRASGGAPPTARLNVTSVGEVTRFL